MENIKLKKRFYTMKEVFEKYFKSNLEVFRDFMSGEYEQRVDAYGILAKDSDTRGLQGIDKDLLNHEKIDKNFWKYFTISIEDNQIFGAYTPTAYVYDNFCYFNIRFERKDFSNLDKIDFKKINYHESKDIESESNYILSCHLQKIISEAGIKKQSLVDTVRIVLFYYLKENAIPNNKIIWNELSKYKYVNRVADNKIFYDVDGIEANLSYKNFCKQMSKFRKVIPKFMKNEK